MKATFLIILIFAFAGLGSAGAPVPSTGALLARLDSLLADRSGVEQRKLSRIAAGGIAQQAQYRPQR